ncbi:uncharacterized protein EDB91DRAFT_454165 [Suillus paluster]|uniref:uncharacterized protein n=1 Tax=Suillus paluster TaxID=48578 RepID=UPI001B861F5F|nr:uncharacterized protein EDB91DRAFT_454165 [Suillus paluster]KAG1738343.1 hypothetical protein EDB91DRAFT_454165 [Suillus paluster]
MFVISNNPSWWPLIDRNRVYSYFVVASCVAVIYDWALTFGQEVELIWRQRWSFMTLLYFGARYAVIPYAVLNILVTLPTVPLTDTVSLIVDLALNWMDLAMNVMLVIMIARLHAMYQRSRKMLIFLIIIFLAVTIVCAAITIRDDFASGMELILSGTYICTYVYTDGVGETYWISIMPWVLTTVWEVLALCLAVWIAARHFYGLHGSSTGWAIGGWFTVLVQPHAM